MHVAGASVAVPVLLDGFEVLDACHRQTLAMLERLEALVAAIERGEVDAAARRTAAEVVQHFSSTARLHHEDEEKHVFPRLAASGNLETVQAVSRLQQDHGWLEEDWRELAPMLDAVAHGQGWADFDALRRGVEVFTALSHDHMALEESLVYPQARARVPAGERRAMGREMAARRRAGAHHHKP
ncbi:MAG: hemerythrin domain-containing protein [Rhizobacter sp.]|nr:hemerythrin domain-containing protein [Rhizobacter sp.]